MVKFVRGETWEDQDEVYETLNPGAGEKPTLHMFFTSEDTPVKKVELWFYGHCREGCDPEGEFPGCGPFDDCTPYLSNPQRVEILRLFNKRSNILFNLENISKEALEKISDKTEKMGIGRIAVWIGYILENELPENMERSSKGKYSGRVYFDIEENKGPWPAYDLGVA